MKVETINSPRAPFPLGNYSHATAYGDFVFVSGIAARDPRTDQVPGLKLDGQGKKIGYDIRAEVHGSMGKVVAEVDEKYPAILYDERGKVSARHDQFVERFADAYRDELQAFVNALHEGSIPTPGIYDALQTMRIAAAATQSRRSGKWVKVSEV